MFRVFKSLLIAIVVSSCSTAPVINTINEKVLSVEDPLFRERLIDLRHQYSEDPHNIEVVLKLRELEDRAVNYYHGKGRRKLEQSDFESARSQTREGLSLVVGNARLLMLLKRIDKQEGVFQLIQSAEQLYSKRSYRTALKRLDDALSIDAASKPARELKERVERDYYAMRRNQSRIDLEFNDMTVRDVYNFIGKTFGLNIIFDDSVKDLPISLDMKAVPFVDAIKLVSQMSKNGYKVFDQKTVMFFSDTKQKREEYEDKRTQTFPLDTISAKEMAGILKSVLAVKDVTTNESANLLIVTDDINTLTKIQRIIAENDVPPGEAILHVEILEVNLSKAERLGINYGDYRISTSTPQIGITDSIRSQYNNVTKLNLPNITLEAFKQAVTAKSLAKPSIRVLDGEKAKIHIGDRVPLRKSSIQDATGQTRTTFEYQEIGIRFNVETDIHSADQLTVKLNLEVSSLGENLGTATEQAFRIGTRNAETTMLINNGETIILGGLLRDENRTSRSGIKGLVELPGGDSLFGSKETSEAQTDLLLTISPRIIRARKDKSQFNPTSSSLNGGRLFTYSVLDSLDLTLPRKGAGHSDPDESEAAPQIIIDQSPSSANSNSRTEADGASNQSIALDVSDSSKDGTPSALTADYSNDSYKGKLNASSSVEISIKGIEQLDGFNLAMNVNQNIVAIQKFSFEGKGWAVNEQSLLEGELILSVSRTDTALPASGTLSIMAEVEPQRKGTSYVITKFSDVKRVGGGAVDNIVPASTKFRVE